MRIFAVVLIVMHLSLAVECSGLPEIEIVMPTRLEFVPRTFDLARTALEKQIGQRVNLHVVTLSPRQPFPKLGVGSWFFLEEGSEKNFLPDGARPLPIFVDFYWLLAVRQDLLSGVATAPPADLTEWEAQLRRLRVRDDQHYPWFDSLFSLNTLCRMFDAGVTASGSAGADGARNTPLSGTTGGGTMQWADNVGETMVPGALIPFLQRAIDRKFLNPLSVEADQNLAFDVFEASDAVFCSLWLPRDVVQSSGKVPELGYDVLWVPFPSPGRQGIVPRVRFRLWAAPPFSLTVERLVGLSPPSSSPLPNVRACSFQDDMSWMKDFGPRMYDLLIMGDL